MNNVTAAIVAYALAWLGTSAAVAVGCYVSGSAWPLLALLFPACISLTSSNKDCKCGEDNEGGC